MVGCPSDYFDIPRCCPKVEGECKTCDQCWAREVPQDETEAADVVNHPSHYETGKFECFDVMVEALGVETVKGFCIGNAFKYLYRHKRKNGDEDIKKAAWYIDRYLTLAEGKDDE